MTITLYLTKHFVPTLVPNFSDSRIRLHGFLNHKLIKIIFLLKETKSGLSICNQNLHFLQIVALVSISRLFNVYCQC